MKRKHLFASAVMAAVLAGCSQDEVIVNDNLQSLGERPMVEAPVFTFNGLESRMTTTGGYAGVQWEAGDGFGYAVIDTYNPLADQTKFNEMFTIVDYINSNIMYHTEDGSNFYSHAESSVPEGNYLIYAPFNKDNISRGPLKVALPLTQVVTPAEGNAPSNSAVTAFYEDDTTPVFVGYDKVFGEPKVEVSPELRHIFALPMVTLKLGDVQLLDANGNLKVDANDDPVYESKITIEAIEFTNDEQKLITEGYIKNSQIEALLKLDLDTDGNPIYNAEKGRFQVKWDVNEYEKNATADLLMKDEYGDVIRVNKNAKYGSVRVDFEEGLTITKTNDGQFFMVLPAAEYDEKDLTIKVFATIKGETYVLTSKSTKLESAAKTIEPEKEVTLLPGLPYSADEYNADGSMKNTKGTSMSYVIEGGFSPASVVIDNYTKVANYDELINFVEKIAYRNTPLEEITVEAAVEAIKNGAPKDPKKYFVITATEANPIMLDDNFIAKFKNACVVNNYDGAKITFLGDDVWTKTAKNVVLGDIEWNSTASKYIKFKSNNVYAGGDVTLKAVPVSGYVLPLEDASITLDATLTENVTVYNLYNGEINLNSSRAHTINNDFGTLNVNVESDAQITNGISSNMFNDENRAEINKALGKDSYDDYESSMVIADDVEVNSVINYATGNVKISDAIVSMSRNDGEVKMLEASGKLAVTSGSGKVNNTVGGKVAASTNEVYANVSTFDLDEKYDALTGLNKLVVNGKVTDPDYNVNTVIKTIDFIEGSGIDFASIAEAELDLSEVNVINVRYDVTWRGRDVTKSTIKVKAGAIKETWAKNSTENYKLTLVDVDVHGFNSTWDGKTISTDDELAAVLIDGVYGVNTADQFAALLAKNWGDAPVEKPIELKIKLNADLDMGGYEMNGMVTPNDYNQGKSFVEIDGNGKTISNLNLKGEENVGLIAVAKVPVTVKNLTVTSSNATANGGYVGIVLGKNEGVPMTFLDVKVKDCGITGTKSVAAIAGHGMGNGQTSPKVKIEMGRCSVTGCTIVATEKRGAYMLGCYTDENELVTYNSDVSANQAVVNGRVVNIAFAKYE